MISLFVFVFSFAIAAAQNRNSVSPGGGPGKSSAKNANSMPGGAITTAPNRNSVKPGSEPKGGSKNAYPMPGGKTSLVNFLNPTLNTSVKCTSTKGNFVVRLVPEWAPIGVSRFLYMVDYGFFYNIAFYRVIENLIAQFGLAGTPKDVEKWSAVGKIKDDPPWNKPFKRGMITFAGSMANSRSTLMLIALNDSNILGTKPWETPIGYVEKGMNVIDSLYSKYGEMKSMGGKGPDTSLIATKGNVVLQNLFPNIDYILNCSRFADFGASDVSSLPPFQSETGVKKNMVDTGLKLPVSRQQGKSTHQTKPIVSQNQPSIQKPLMSDLLKCRFDMCGKKPSEGDICSCNYRCIETNTCCDGFQTVCPKEYAKTAIQTSRCTSEACGGSFAVDSLGTNIICSCQEDCLAEAECCDDFESACPLEYDAGMAKMIPKRCEKTSCGSVHGPTSNPFCSCRADCVDDGICCPNFMWACMNEQYYDYSDDWLNSIYNNFFDIASVSTLPPPSPQCMPDDCGFALSLNDSIACLCHKDCLRDSNCCEGFAKVCLNQTELPNDSDIQLPQCEGAADCDSDFQSSTGEFICSCHPSCTKSGQCCSGFEVCLSNSPVCTMAKCGGNFTADVESRDVICSCHHLCVFDGNCCKGFQDNCGEEFALLRTS